MVEMSEELSGSGSRTRDSLPRRFRRDLRPRLFDLSTEDLIDYLRCALAAVAIFACLIVPPFSNEDGTLIHTVLVWYFVYSVVVLVIARRWPDAPVWPFATHVIDVGVAALLMHLTEGSHSPCFIFFMFALISAGLRWDWRGAIFTTLALLLLLIVIDVDRDAETLLHGTYIVVAGLLVAYFSGLRAYNRERLAKLAT